MIFKYTKYPKAAKEFIRFMMEEEQYGAWLQRESAIPRALSSPTRKTRSGRWTRSTRPTATPASRCVPAGYAGKLGYASAGALADFIIVDMSPKPPRAISRRKKPSSALPNGPKDTTRFEKQLFRQQEHPRCCFMLPAGVLLLLFLTYPLGLAPGSASPTPRSPYRPLDRNRELPVPHRDSVARLSLFNTLFYTIVASVLKFVLGLWLALILKPPPPVQVVHRRSCCCRSSCDGALRNRVLVDLRFPVLGRELDAREMA